MSDWLPDSPVVSRQACPTCEPALDLTREIIEVRYCPAHELHIPGSADDLTTGEPVRWGSGPEAEGADCRRMAQLLKEA